MSDIINTVILAAGKGTRLKLDIAKPLCQSRGKKLVDYVLEGVSEFSLTTDLEVNYHFIVGYKGEEVKSYVESKHSEKNIQYVEQKEQLGTGHALKIFFENDKTASKSKYTIVVCADTPLISPSTYKKMLDIIDQNNLDAVCASFTAKNPMGYGRIIKGKEKGFKIREEKDASAEEKKIQEVNSGLYIFKTDYIENHIAGLTNKNNSGEFYLTDLFKDGDNVEAIQFPDEVEFIGVNNLVQLEEITIELNKRKVRELQLSGVQFINSSNVIIEDNVQIKAGSVIYPNVVLEGVVNIEEDVIIESGSILKNSSIKSGTVIKAYSYIEGAMIGHKNMVGPMARLREGTNLENECKIGNFVEIKKSFLDQGVKVSHLSYVGDAKIGENTNIGCGFITCNYDGANKHETIIGKNSFIGSDCQMIAPVTIGDESYVGSGSTINKNVPSGAFAIARERQVTKENMAKKFIKKK